MRIIESNNEIPEIVSEETTIGVVVIDKPEEKDNNTNSYEDVIEYISKKFYASNLCLTIASYYNKNGLIRLSKCFINQSKEELQDAWYIYNKLLENNVVVYMHEVDGCDIKFEDSQKPLKVYKDFTEELGNNLLLLCKNDKLKRFVSDTKPDQCKKIKFANDCLNISKQSSDWLLIEKSICCNE